jgi:16S rRNA (cytosine967-C5)-methyltransferase
MRALTSLEESERPLNAILDAMRLEDALGFARELSSGVQRWRSRLDWTLAPLLEKKPLEKLDAPVRAALRLALYERAVLQTPARAVANEYAGLMRDARLKSAVGFVNAIARRLPDEWRASPAREKNPARFLSVESAHPEWMAARWIERLGFEAAGALCRANNEVAPADLRLNTARATREQVLAALREREIMAAATPLSPHGIRIARRERGEDSDAPASTSTSAPWQWPEWERGWLLAQDEAAQLVALALGAAPGERVLDVASAPGGKATHLAQLGARVTAADRSGERLGKVRDNAARLGLENVEFLEGDAAQVLGAVQSGALPPFDGVLLDAPCSGTGTLRRRPDAKWRKSLGNLDELVALQAELLDAAAGCVRPAGTLAYSTCSLEDEENAGAVRAFLIRHPQWKLAPPSDRWVAREVWDSLAAAPDLPGAVATRPNLHGCDGMFCAILRREG